MKENNIEIKKNFVPFSLELYSLYNLPLKPSFDLLVNERNHGSDKFI